MRLQKKLLQKEETKFRKRFDKFVDTLPNTYSLSVQQTTICGDPDKILCINGFFIAVELKASELAKVSRLQLYKLQKIVDAGGFGLVCHPQNFNVTKEVLTKFSEMKDAKVKMEDVSKP